MLGTCARRASSGPSRHCGASRSMASWSTASLPGGARRFAIGSTRWKRRSTLAGRAASGWRTCGCACCGWPRVGGGVRAVGARAGRGRRRHDPAPRQAARRSRVGGASATVVRRSPAARDRWPSSTTGRTWRRSSTRMASTSARKICR